MPYNPSRFVVFLHWFMQKILIATRNEGKFREISEYFNGMDIQTFSPDDLKIVGDCEETGKTYRENAEIKARFYYEKTDGNMLVLADDSGIVVEAIADELGVYTRRWGVGHEASDAEWLDFFLKRMSVETNRKAKFICELVLYDGKEMKYFEGEVLGTILEKLEVPIKAGVPLSSVFRPDGMNQVFSAMSIEDKSKNSHRGRAMNKLTEYLKRKI